MRYTTIIDLTEFPDIWKNANCTRLYLYMALRCGYHDQDRDVLTMSTRNLALGAGITHSACRHALRVLQAHQLLLQEGNAWRVKKFVLDIKPTPRKQSTTSGSSDSLVRTQLEAEANERGRETVLAQATKEELQALLEGLRDHKVKAFKGYRFYPSEGTIEDIESLIKRK